MAAVLTNKVEMYNQAEFTVDAVADISKLPTTTTGGTDELSYMGPIRMGSTAFVIATSSVYMLGSNDEWTEI